MATHSSTLAWRIPWMGEPGRLQSMGSLRVGHDWATSLSLFTFTRWRRKWQPPPVFVPGESQGRGSLLSMGSHRVGHDWSDSSSSRAYHYLYWYHQVTFKVVEWTSVFFLQLASWVPVLSLLGGFHLSPSSPCLSPMRWPIKINPRWWKHPDLLKDINNLLNFALSKYDQSFNLLVKSSVRKINMVYISANFLYDPINWRTHS